MVAVDFETTGLDCQRNSIVSIAVVLCRSTDLYVASAAMGGQSTLNGRICRYSRYYSLDIQSAPDIEAILPELLDLVAGKIWVVHYNGIERPFLQKAMDAFQCHRYRPLTAFRQRRSFWSRLMGKRLLSIRLADSREPITCPFTHPMMRSPMRLHVLSSYKRKSVIATVLIRRCKIFGCPRKILLGDSFRWLHN